jgi:hypothetical protein
MHANCGTRFVVLGPQKETLYHTGNLFSLHRVLRNLRYRGVSATSLDTKTSEPVVFPEGIQSGYKVLQIPNVGEFQVTPDKIQFRSSNGSWTPLDESLETAKAFRMISNRLSAWSVVESSENLSKPKKI